MSSNLFIVMETGFEYNDEVYYSSEHGGGSPVVAYTTEEAAQKEADRRTLDFLKGMQSEKSYHEIGEYGYDLSEIFNNVGRDILEEAGYEGEGLWDLSLKILSEDQLQRLAEGGLNLQFYSVYQVDLKEEGKQ